MRELPELRGRRQVLTSLRAKGRLRRYADGMFMQGETDAQKPNQQDRSDRPFIAHELRGRYLGSRDLFFRRNLVQSGALAPFRFGDPFLGLSLHAGHDLYSRSH